MDRQLPAPRRPASDGDAPPSPSSSARGPLGSDPRRTIGRIVAGLVVGALTMLGVAILDTTTGAQVPVLGSFAAAAAGPVVPEVIEVPAPPSTPGTCLSWTREDAADTAVVDCAAPHLFEQAGPVLLADQVELPDSEVWRQLVTERCGPVVLEYLGNQFDPNGRFKIGALSPSPSRWAAGDRELRCGLQSASRSGALYPISGRVAETDQSAVQEAGTCLGIDGLQIGDPVDCSGLHSVETVGVVDLSAQFPDAFPVTADQDAFLQPECNRIAAEYAGNPDVIGQQGLTVYWNNILESSWAAGSRRVNCNLGALLPDRSGFAPVTGPISGQVVVGAEAAPPATDVPAAGQPAPTTVPVVPPSTTVPTTEAPTEGTGEVPPPSTDPTTDEQPPLEGEIPPSEELPPPVEPAGESVVPIP